MAPKRAAAKEPPAPKRGGKAAAAEPPAAPKRGGKAASAPEPEPPARAPPKAKAASAESAPTRTPPAAVEDSAEDYDSWAAPKLKARLQELGVSTSGTKQVLIDRLKAVVPAAVATPVRPSAKEPVEATEPAAKRPKAAGAKAPPSAASGEEPPAKRGKAAPPSAPTSEPSIALEAASQVYFEDGEFKSEYAKSSRSGCKRCNEKILEGSLRLGKMVQSDKFDGKMPVWHHAKCFLESGLLPRSTALIAGFSMLKPEDQESVASKIPSGDAAGSSSSGLSPELKKQNEQVFAVMDSLRSLGEKKVKEMLELNDYPTIKLRVNSSLQDLAADGIVFGATGRCEVCATEEKEGGHVLLHNEGYKCTGWINEFLSCQFRTQEPVRGLWQLTDAAEQVPALKKLKLTTGNRLFATKLAEEGTETSGGASASTAKPALLGLHIAVEKVNEAGTIEALAKLVRDHGGTISASISKATSCVVSTSEDADEEAEVAYVATAKELFVPGVTEDFIHQSIQAGSQCEMTPYLLWGEGRKTYNVETVETKFIEKAGVMMDADVGELAKTAHVLVDRSQGRVYSEQLNQTDMVSGANSYYTMHLLESDHTSGEEPSYWVFRKWGRIGIKIGGTKLEEFAHNKSKALASFSKQYLDKTGNTFGHKQDEFEPKAGKFIRVDIAHKALHAKKGEVDGGGDGQPVQTGVQLSKAQIEKADKVLDRIKAALESGATGASATATFMSASAEYYSLIPHNFGMKKPPTINSEELMGQEKALLQFFLRMGFEEIGGEDEEKLTPIGGVMELPLPKTLMDAAQSVCPKAEINNCTKKGAVMAAKKAGKPRKPMDKELYGSVLLYTSNACYKQLNKALREEDRAEVQKYFPYLRTLFEACDRLPTETTTLWRGVGVDLLSQYKAGSTITWWGVSSCTSNQKVAQDFANSCGDKSTFLTVETKTACNISEVSIFPNESESILLPGTQLEVVSAERKGKQAHIRLREVGRAVG